MRKRIHENIIHIGEPLLWDLFSNDNRIMFRKGFVVRSKDNLEKILGLTLFYNDDKNTNPAENMEPSVFIKSNTTKGSRQISITTSPRKKEASSLFFEDISSMQQERNVILKFHNNEIPSPFTFFNYLDFCASQSKAIQDDILYGKLKNTAPIEALADHIIDIADTSIDACLGAIHLDHQHSISVLHPIYCAFLCIITAKKLNLPNDTIKSIVCAALTANVGMYEVFDTLFHRAGGLNDKEKQLIRNHPVKSEKMLKNIGVTDKIWLRTIIQHHERVDGRGYPKALKSSQINIESLIYSSADTYLAQILPRKSKERQTPKSVLQALFKIATETNNTALHTMIKTLGMYPPGSIVRLANFEQAIVAYRTKNSLQPKVVCYKSSNGTRLKKLILRETDTPSYEIINSAIDSCTEVDLNRVWDIKIDKFSEEEIQI